MSGCEICRNFCSTSSKSLFLEFGRRLLGSGWGPVQDSFLFSGCLDETRFPFYAVLGKSEGKQRGEKVENDKGRKERRESRKVERRKEGRKKGEKKLKIVSFCTSLLEEGKNEKEEESQKERKSPG